MKKIKLIFVLAVTLLAAVSCLKSTNKQNFTWDVSFEEEGLKFHADDSTCFNSFVSFGNLIGFSAVVSGEENENLLGGFGICRGVDPTLTGTAAKTPYHCFAHPYLENEKTFAVFRQSGNMPEEQIIFNIPSAQSTISPRGVMLCNTHNFIQIAKLGNGFGEGKFTSGDWAEVKFTGSLNGAETGSVSFRMADLHSRSTANRKGKCRSSRASDSRCSCPTRWTACSGSGSDPANPISTRRKRSGSVCSRRTSTRFIRRM